MIPKRIFFYWGNEELSWMRYMTLYSFRKMNPDWEMVLYYSKCDVKTKTWKTDNTQDFFNFIGKNYINKINELNIKIIPWDLSDNKIIDCANISTMCASHKSNFLKWCILHDEGGIYSDLDVIYFKPIAAYYNMLNDNNYDSAICQTQYLSIGFLASKQNNDFFKDIFINGFKNYSCGFYQSAGVDNIYNLYKGVASKDILNVAIQKYPYLKFYNIPFNLVYPFGSENIPYPFFTNVGLLGLSEKTIGYHWYAGHPTAQEFNNLLNENNYINYNNLFCNIAKIILKK